jgi:uncharacterized membrane protein YeaQ/YmgE (transglycosylase-associated protein family)
MLRRGMVGAPPRLICVITAGEAPRFTTGDQNDMEPFSGFGIIAILIIGAVAGWLAGQIVRGYGFGIIGNIIVGIIGAVIGSWLLAQLGVSTGGGWLGAIIGATIGAIVLLLIIGLFRRA